VITAIVGGAITVLLVAGFVSDGRWMSLVLAAVFGTLTATIARGLLRHGPRVVATATELLVVIGATTIRVPWETLQGATVSRVLHRRSITLQVSSEWTPELGLEGPRWLVALAQRRKLQDGRELLVPYDVNVDKTAFAEWLDGRAQAD
jgi:hypothetical protein